MERSKKNIYTEETAAAQNDPASAPEAPELSSLNDDSLDQVSGGGGSAQSKKFVKKPQVSA